jgi:hypothetical protein
LPYPSLSFDMLHCARCGIDWEPWGISQNFSITNHFFVRSHFFKIDFHMSMFSCIFAKPSHYCFFVLTYSLTGDVSGSNRMPYDGKQIIYSCACLQRQC